MKRLLILPLVFVGSLTPQVVRAESPERPSEVALSALEAWEVHRDSRDYLRFVEARRAAAKRVAAAIGAEYKDIEDAWRLAPVAAQVVVLSALAQVGKDYIYATSDPDRGFDCSGLTRYAWEEAGYDIPQTSTAQLRELEPVEEGTEQPGDILARSGHVAIWIGVEDLIVHAANRREDVIVSRADLSRYRLVRPATQNLRTLPPSTSPKRIAR